MNSRHFAAALALAAIFAIPAGQSAQAAEGDRPLNHRWSQKIDTHVRYPGDREYSFGNTRVSGTDQGPYVEKCTWEAGSSLFGLPVGFVQKCRRYTLENTR